MKNIIITGGAGFIGSHLVDHLTRDNQHVRVLEHPNANVDHLPLNKIELVRADIRDISEINKAVRGLGQRGTE
jgi:dihydroflavonol-4-reductase